MQLRHLLATCFIALTLALPAAGYLLFKAFDQIGDNLSQARAINVFIEDQPQARLEQLISTLTRYEQIERAELVTIPVNPTLAGTDIARIVELIPTAGLPADSFSALVEQLHHLPGAELVSWNDDTLARNLQASTHARMSAVASLALAALLFIVITWGLIRKNIRSSKEIVDIKHQLGATPLQICRPMLLKGILLGLITAYAGYAIAAVEVHILTGIVDISIFKIDIQPGFLQIFLYFSAVIIISYVITRMAFKRIYFYIYQ